MIDQQTKINWKTLLVTDDSDYFVLLPIFTKNMTRLEISLELRSSHAFILEPGIVQGFQTVILDDCLFWQNGGRQALRVVRDTYPDCPVIILYGCREEDLEKDMEEFPGWLALGKTQISVEMVESTLHSIWEKHVG